MSSKKDIVWDDESPAGAEAGIKWDDHAPPKHEIAPLTADPTEGMSGGEKFLVGMGANTAKAIEGVGSLFDRFAGPTRKAELAKMKDDREAYERNHPGWQATGGEIAGDLMLSAIPVAKAGQVATKAAATLPRSVARFAPAIADIGANAAYSAATAPENRGTAAGLAALGTAGGRGVTRVVTGPVRPSVAGQAALDAGERLTPGQAGGGMMGYLANQYEQGLSRVPIIGAPVRAARRRGLEDSNVSMLRSVEPPNVRNANLRPGSEGLEDVRGAYSNSYDTMLPRGTPIRLDPPSLQGYDTIVGRLARDVPPNHRAAFHEAAEQIRHDLGNGIDASHWKATVTDVIRDASNNVGEHNTRQAFTALRNELNGMLPNVPGMPREVADLSATDAGYRGYKVLEKAMETARAARRGGVAYPEDVVTAANAAGHTPLLNRALEAQRLHGRAPEEGGVRREIGDYLRSAAMLGPFAITNPGKTAAAAVSSLLGTTELGRRLLLGQVPWQQFAERYPQIANTVMSQLPARVASQGTPQSKGEQNAP